MDEIYKSEKWKRKRAHILKRDQYQCKECRKYGKLTPAKIVHHIKEIEDYPELAWDDSNLESVCMACHNRLHKETGAKSLERQKYYRGRMA